LALPSELSFHSLQVQPQGALYLPPVHIARALLIGFLASFLLFCRYWSRNPTGAEFLVQTIVAINAGARGSVSWNDPTTPDIKGTASAFALALPELTPFFLSSPLGHPPVHFTHVVTPNRLDFGVWVSPKERRTLVLGTNLNYFTVNVTLSEVFSGSAAGFLALAGNRTCLVLDGGGRIYDSQFVFGAMQSGAWIFG